MAGPQPQVEHHRRARGLRQPEPVLDGFDDRRDGVVGLAYAVRQVAQLLLMCDQHDIGISIDMESSTFEPTTETTEVTGTGYSTLEIELPTTENTEHTAANPGVVPGDLGGPGGEPDRIGSNGPPPETTDAGGGS